MQLLALESWIGRDPNCICSENTIRALSVPNSNGINGRGTLTTVDKTPYSISGDVFMVGPLDSKFDGTATVTIPYNATLAPQASEVKIFHYTGSS